MLQMMKDNQRRASIMFIVVMVVLSIPFFSVSAAPTSADTCDQAVSLEVPIGDTILVYGLAEYIGILYQFIISAIAILSAVMMMFNGMRWATAGGNSESVGVAKDGFVSALIGLLIALMSYVLLNAINPALVNINAVCPDAPVFAPSPQVEYKSCISKETSECTQYEYCNEPIGTCFCSNINGNRPAATPDYRCVSVREEVSEGGSCLKDSSCVSPLKCINPTPERPGTCMRANIGSNCTTDAECTGGTSCIQYDQVNLSGKKCYYNDERPLGIYCVNDEQCLDGLVCHESQPGAQCIYGDGTDTNIGCNNESDCVPGYKCESLSSSILSGAQCTIKVEGDSCSSLNTECPPDWFCVEVGLLNTGTCYDGSPGDPCDTSSDCSSSICDPTTNICL